MAQKSYNRILCSAEMVRRMMELNVSKLNEEIVSNPSLTLKQKVYRGMQEYLIVSAYLWVVFVLLIRTKPFS